MALTATRRVPLLDLGAIHRPIRDEILAELTRVFDSQAFILGPDVSALEREVAAYCQVPHAVGCASGSAALLLALVTAEVEPGDRVLTTPFTFFATAGAIHHAGARPVFADIDPVTFNLDPAAVAEIASRERGIKALIPVDLYGGVCDMDPLNTTALANGWTVIEDGAQAIGARYGERSALSLATLGCLSFFPSKNLGALGDAGMVTTTDAAMATRLRSLRMHGSTRKYFHDSVGFNSRLDTLQAAALRVKLRYLDRHTEARRQNALRYGRLLAGSAVRLPQPASYQNRHVFNQYVIRAPRRDELKAYLAGQGIGTEIYYPLPLHLQECFRHLEYRMGDFPHAEAAAAEVLALPIHSALEADDIEYVAGHIRQFYAD